MDHTPITGKELADMKRRCENATKGPWWWWTSSGDNPVRLHTGSDGSLMRISDDGGFLLFDDEDDEDFIENARTDLPRCIAEIEHLRDVIRFYADADPTERSIDSGSLAHRTLNP